MLGLVRMSLYDISFLHPADWQLALGKGVVSYHRGSLTVLSPDAAISLELLWDRRDGRSLEEVHAYLLRGLQAAYKSSFRLLGEGESLIGGHLAFWSRVVFAEKSGLFWGKEMLERIHLICSCETTERLTLLYLTGSADAGSQVRELRECIWQSFSCHV